MIRKFVVLALTTFAASSSHADEIAIKPKIIHSQIQADAEGYSIGGFNRDFSESRSSESINGLGFELAFEFKLDDRARLGSEFSLTNYEEDEAEASDMALGGFLAYDFISQSNMSVYGKGGLSLHQFAFEDFNSASLLNGDLGVGVALAVTPSLDLGGEYRYSTTLGKGDMSAEDSSLVKLNDVSIERNDLALFLAFKF